MLPVRPTDQVPTCSPFIQTLSPFITTLLLAILHAEGVDWRNPGGSTHFRLSPFPAALAPHQEPQALCADCQNSPKMRFFPNRQSVTGSSQFFGPAEPDSARELCAESVNAETADSNTRSSGAQPLE